MTETTYKQKASKLPKTNKWTQAPFHWFHIFPIALSFSPKSHIEPDTGDSLGKRIFSWYTSNNIFSLFFKPFNARFPLWNLGGGMKFSLRRGNLFPRSEVNKKDHILDPSEWLKIVTSTENYISVFYPCHKVLKSKAKLRNWGFRRNWTCFTCVCLFVTLLISEVGFALTHKGLSVKYIDYSSLPSRV